MMKIRHYIFLLIPLILQSCFKEDDRVTPHDPGNLTTDTVGMTEYYKYQVYYSFETGQAVKSVNKASWDLGFSCDSAGVRVILNTSNFMRSAVLPGHVFGTPADTSGVDWHFDKSDGNPDSAAFLNWISIAGNDTSYAGNTWIVDRGMDELGNVRGLRQLVLDSLKGDTYYFRFAAKNGTGVTSFSITKDPTRNYTCFSFASGGAVADVEPPKETWDVVFTQYTTLLFTDIGEAYPYLVTGVLINPYKVEAAQDNQNAFEAITGSTLASLDFSKNWDKIGYEWKQYDFDAGVYTVNPDKIYVVQSVSGFYFKLRFVGFYSLSLEKGYPSFEYQKL